MAHLWYDLRDASRALLRSRGYTVVVALTLGLGIGLNTAIFTVVDALLLKPLPFSEPERLVRVAEWPKTGGNFTVAPSAYLRWRDEVKSFSHFEARIGRTFVLLTGSTAAEVRGLRVTARYFEMLGAGAAIGRTFAPADAEAGAPCAAVISHRLWTTRLASDPAIVGKPLRFSGLTCTVVGVLPGDTVFDRTASDVYVPLTFAAADAANNGRQLSVLGRLAPGATLEGARVEMTALADAFNATRGPAGHGWTTALTPLRDVVIGADARWLAGVLFGAVVVVLIVACLNVGGLALSRTAGRRREIAIRVALGASRWRVFRYLFVESTILAASGGAAGLLLGGWGLRALLSFVPPGLIPAETTVALDIRALLFTAGLASVTGVFFGTYPAWRSTAVDPVESLGAGGRTAAGSRRTTRIHSALLVVEVACAMILVVGATALVTSFARLVRVDPGFARHQVFTTRVTLPRERYSTLDATVAALNRILEGFRQIPGVEFAGGATSLPLGGWLYGSTFTIVGDPPRADVPPSAHIQHTTDGYFEALGITLSAGRSFTAKDDARAPRVAIVNDTFVRRFGGGSPMVGRQLRLGAGVDAVACEVVGVIHDVKTGGLADAELATPEVYVPYAQNPAPSMEVAVRAASRDAAAVASGLRAALAAVDPELPLGPLLTMDERLGLSVRRERFRTVMIATFAVLALLLASVGIYAIRSQAVAARTREMGIRVALGATRRQLMAMVLNRGFVEVAIGLAAGAAGSLALARVVEPWLFATRATDPRILLAAIVLFSAAALLASWVPARRAASVDPLALLRQD